MAVLKLKVRGLEQLLGDLAKLDQDVQRGIDDAVNATGLELRADIVRRYQRGPATGRTYQKYNPRRTHQASAPGQAPMTDTGRLAAGTVYNKVGFARVRVENCVKYARALEYGNTSGKGNIAPRPAWRPAIKKMRPIFRKRMERVLAEAVNRAT